MIAYLRVVPGFWIAAEELQRPDLRSYPVIVGGLPHQRGVVREANVVAQRRGVRPGMALSQANHQCPDAVFLIPDLSRYESLWQKICDLLQTYTPLVEPIEMGQAVCDLSGCERRWRDDWDAGIRIVGAIYRDTGIAPCLGIASNRLTAQLASLMPNDTGVIVVESGQEAAFLAGLPITLLPDVDPRLALSFQVLGLQTIGQFAALPPSAVEHRFGALGKRLHAYARGMDPRPVRPLPTRPSVSARYECEDGSPEEALAALEQLAEKCAAELQQRHLAGRLVELTLLWEANAPRGIGKNREELPEERPLPRPDHGDSEIALPLPNPRPSLPVPYRIHSGMAQPGMNPSAAPPSSPGPLSRTAGEGECLAPALPPLASGRGIGGEGALTAAKVAVRVAIGTAPPLVEQGQRLLQRSWPQTARKLQGIELKVSEFEAPVQLGFAECMRLDQTGGLAGLGPERRQAIMQQERVLAARYGDDAFRHVAHVDPASVLTERRFRWQPGLAAAFAATPGSERCTRTSRRRA